MTNINKVGGSGPIQPARPAPLSAPTVETVRTPGSGPLDAAAISAKLAAGVGPLAGALLSDAEIDAGLAGLTDAADPLRLAVEHGRLSERQLNAYADVCTALAGADPMTRSLWAAWSDEQATTLNFTSEAGRELLSIAAHQLREETPAPAGQTRVGYVSQLTWRFNRLPQPETTRL
ncbi:MAG: hypothetical protein JWM80_6226 [Cyanobacteria bacterium RYN_339]|nr:hypothetical protein [Cyanobacteria bacterium RYN_339]